MGEADTAGPSRNHSRRRPTPRCEPIYTKSSQPSVSRFHSRDIPTAHAGRAAPEQERQEDHEEGMGAEVGGECEVGIEGRGADFLLHPGEVGCFISNQWDELLSRPVAPERQSGRVWGTNARRLAGVCAENGRAAYNGSNSSGQHRAGLLCSCPCYRRGSSI